MYYIYPGNNHRIIEAALQRRKGWVKGTIEQVGEAKFIWKPVSFGLRYGKSRPMVNHLE
jgi:hypothetical protein